MKNQGVSSALHMKVLPRERFGGGLGHSRTRYSLLLGALTAYTMAKGPWTSKWGVSTKRMVYVVVNIVVCTWTELVLQSLSY